MKKSYSRRRGNTFLVAGMGRYGPYAAGTRRVKRVETVKGTIGTKGVIVSVKRNIGSRKFEVGYNLTAKTPYFRAGNRSRRRGR